MLIFGRSGFRNRPHCSGGCVSRQVELGVDRRGGGVCGRCRLIGQPLRAIWATGRGWPCLATAPRRCSAARPQLFWARRGRVVKVHSARSSGCAGRRVSGGSSPGQDRSRERRASGRLGIGPAAWLCYTIPELAKFQDGDMRSALIAKFWLSAINLP